MPRRRVIAYVDGLNLFYSSLKGTKYKWLDLVSLCESFLMPGDELADVKYVSALKSDAKQPQKALDQKIYIEALRSCGKFSDFLGFFSVHKVRLPLASDWGNGKTSLVEVISGKEYCFVGNVCAKMPIFDFLQFLNIFKNHIVFI